MFGIPVLKKMLSPRGRDNKHFSQDAHLRRAGFEHMEGRYYGFLLKKEQRRKSLLFPFLILYKVQSQTGRLIQLERGGLFFYLFIRC